MESSNSSWIETQLRLKAAIDQLLRYGEVDKTVITLLEKLSDLNDDIVNMRCKDACIKPITEDMKSLLNKILMEGEKRKLDEQIKALEGLGEKH